MRKETQLVTRVGIQGLPVSPVKVAKEYSIAVGVIAREGVRITCREFRAKAQKKLEGSAVDQAVRPIQVRH